MRERAKLAAIALAFLALFGFLVFQVGVASHYPERHNQQTATTENGEHKNIFERFWEWTTDDPVAVYTLVLAISTIGLWFVTRQGIRNQSREMRILQRAYIRAVPKGIGTMTTGELVGQISFENEGRLPATNFKWIVKLPTAGNADWRPPKLHDSDLLEYSSIVPVAGIFRRGTDPVSPGSFGGCKYWFVWGRVKYLDGFGKDRFVDFVIPTRSPEESWRAELVVVATAFLTNTPAIMTMETTPISAAMPPCRSPE
jgi:hypothetical protein